MDTERCVRNNIPWGWELPGWPRPHSPADRAQSRSTALEFSSWPPAGEPYLAEDITIPGPHSSKSWTRTRRSHLEKKSSWEEEPRNYSEAEPWDSDDPPLDRTSCTSRACKAIEYRPDSFTNDFTSPLSVQVSKRWMSNAQCGLRQLGELSCVTWSTPSQISNQI